MTLPLVIVWFRQDLRLLDNPALDYACKIGSIIPLYILDDTLPDWDMGSAQNWWLHHSLTDLGKNLDKYKVQLILRKGNPEKILGEIIAVTGAKFVTWNRCYNPQSIIRDTKLKQLLIEKNIEVKSFNGSLLLEPGSVTNKSGTYFKVFTPYWKECLARINPKPILEIPQFTSHALNIKSDDLSDWNLLPTKPDWAEGFKTYFSPGEKGAHEKLTDFLENDIGQYGVNRDIPGIKGTSLISPHLHFGEISINYIFSRLNEVIGKTHLSGAYKYLSELGWREFSYHLLYNFPDLPRKAFNPKFADFPWTDNEAKFNAWKKGQTGYPIVDAGMRQLWKTGWMHNRVRMITASFLTKHLMIPWQKGAEYFLDTLLDADIASNSAGWQWVAGCGADAAPYFRIFNPITQGQKFDPQGKYVRKFVPEIATLPDQYIHSPWTANLDTLAETKIMLGTTYPRPIVDHADSRQEALAAYESIK